MTLVNYWGFDNLSESDFQQNFFNINPSYLDVTITDRFGNANGAIQAGTTFASLALVYPGMTRTNNPKIFGFAAKHIGTNDDLYIEFSDKDPTYPMLKFVITDTGNLTLLRRDKYSAAYDTLYAIAMSSISVWHYYEIAYYAYSTNGYFKLWVDGIQVINDIGDYHWGNNGGSYHEDGYLTTARLFGNWYLDDMYLIEVDGTSPNTPLGDIHVEQLVPSANGTTNNGTASSGSNYECVDEVQQNGDTDYVTLDAVDEIELYAINNISVTDGDIHAVKIRNCCRKDSTGDRYAQALVRVNGTNYASGNDISINNSYIFEYGSSGQIWVLNPDDSAAWEIADINALESGIKITA